MKLLSVFILLFGFNVFASDTSSGPDMDMKKVNSKNWAKMKEERVNHISQKISQLTQHKECMVAANSKDAVKKCAESHKGTMKEMRGKWKDKVKGKRAEWKSKREEMKRKRKEMRKNKKDGE